jgi:hypothetical protein
MYDNVMEILGIPGYQHSFREDHIDKETDPGFTLLRKDNSSLAQ